MTQLNGHHVFAYYVVMLQKYIFFGENKAFFVWKVISKEKRECCECARYNCTQWCDKQYITPHGNSGWGLI